jgi:acyl dehydratase
VVAWPLGPYGGHVLRFGDGFGKPKQVISHPENVRPWQLDAATAAAFADAYGDTCVSPSSVAPPMALVIGSIGFGVGPLVQQLLGQNNPLRLRALVHREEELVWHAPLPIAAPLFVRAWVRTHDVRRAGEFLNVCTTLTDASGNLLATTQSGLFVRPLATLFPTRTGSKTVPPKGLPAGRPLPAWHVAADAPDRYAAASQETNPIHLDDAVARSAGLPGRILHGLCTMAYSARSVLQAGQAQGPVRLHKLCARFVKPVFLHDTLTCRVLTESPSHMAFDVVQQDGHVVLGRGAAEFVPA